MARRIVIAGAAGLVGQNLISANAEEELGEKVVIDKHPANTAILRKLHPGRHLTIYVGRTPSCLARRGKVLISAWLTVGQF
jgi:nucleoside-diphosphate-sugar epimerase